MNLQSIFSSGTITVENEDATLSVFKVTESNEDFFEDRDSIGNDGADGDGGSGSYGDGDGGSGSFVGDPGHFYNFKKDDFHFQTELGANPSFAELLEIRKSVK